MKIKILINKISDQTVINQGIDKVKVALASIDFPVEITIENINKTFTGTTFNNTAVGKGSCVIPQQILSCVGGTDDVAFLLYSWFDVLPKPTNPCQSPVIKGNTTPCQMPIEWYNAQPDVFRDFMIHELCHALYYLQNSVYQDITHNQQSFPEWQQKPNIDYYLYLLSKLNYNKAEVTIERSVDTTIETLGNLTAKNNGLTFTCKTLELPWLGNHPNISCVPLGTYKCKKTFSLKFMKNTYEILGVPDRTGIRIHKANHYKDLNGCIALGNGFKDLDGDMQLDTINSGITVDSFNNFMGGREFTLIIKEKKYE